MQNAYVRIIKCLVFTLRLVILLLCKKSNNASIFQYKIETSIYIDKIEGVLCYFVSLIQIMNRIII